MTLQILFLAAAAVAATAIASELETLGSIQDPALLDEMSKAEDANLDNALERGGKDASSSAANIRALMLDTALELKAAVGLLRDALGDTADAPADSLGAEAEDLVIASQMLETRARAFDAKTAEAGVALAKEDGEKLLSRRRRYRARDRKGDLKRAEDFYARASRKLKQPRAALDGPHAALVAAARDFVSESKAALARGRALQKALRGGGGDRESVSASRDLEPRLASLDADASDLEREARMLELALGMQRLDEAAFDGGK